MSFVEIMFPVVTGALIGLTFGFFYLLRITRDIQKKYLDVRIKLIESTGLIRAYLKGAEDEDRMLVHFNEQIKRAGYRGTYVSFHQNPKLIEFMYTALMENQKVLNAPDASFLNKILTSPTKTETLDKRKKKS